MKMTAKATVNSVRLDMISKMDIAKPTQIEEQIKIANFFEITDNLISNQEYKLEKYNKIKTALLQQVFI